MSETKFTPGPWEVQKRLDIYAGTVATTVAHCYDRIRDESKFNAALISAAPELYEALDAALGMTRGEGPPNWDEIRKVMKKARGEAS